MWFEWNLAAEQWRSRNFKCAVILQCFMDKSVNALFCVSIMWLCLVDKIDKFWFAFPSIYPYHPSADVYFLAVFILSSTIFSLCLNFTVFLCRKFAAFLIWHIFQLNFLSSCFLTFLLISLCICTISKPHSAQAELHGLQQQHLTKFSDCFLSGYFFFL